MSSGTSPESLKSEPSGKLVEKNDASSLNDEATEAWDEVSKILSRLDEIAFDISMSAFAWYPIMGAGTVSRNRC